MYTVGLDGQAPRQVLADLLAQFTTFTTAWHPDSRRISIWGIHVTDGPSFWTAPLAGGRPVKSDVAQEVRAGFGEGTLRFIDGDNAALPFMWSRSGDTLYFEGVSRGVRNVWAIDVNPSTFEWTAGPVRLTTSSDLNEGISLSPDGTKLALAVRKERTRLWSLPMDAASGQVLGPGEPITADTVDALTPVLSRDGTKLLYATVRGGTQEIWERTLAGGEERLLVPGDKYRRVSPMWSHDNSRVMYLRTLGPDAVSAARDVVMIPVSGGPEQALRTAAPVARLFDWSADGAWILAAHQEKTPRGFALAFVRADGTGPVDVRVLAHDPNSNLFKARLSTDQQWVGYVAGTGPGVSAIYAVRAGGGPQVAITGGDHFDDRPRWSPDSRVIYFLSNRSGFLNVWGRRFDPARGEPVGDPFPVTRFDSPAQMVPPRMVQVGMAISHDRLILPVSEASGNVWILDGVDQ
jgi:Tol biopolymer transport system component